MISIPIWRSESQSDRDREIAKIKKADIRDEVAVTMAKAIEEFLEKER